MIIQRSFPNVNVLMHEHWVNIVKSKFKKINPLDNAGEGKAAPSLRARR
jgi:hypothetical protein